MKKIILSIALFTFTTAAFAQFEGTIEFRMETKKDTTTNIYYVKGNNVKLDQIGKKSGKVEGSFVFDLAGKSIKFVNPARKVWGDHKSETPPTINGTCEITKAKTTKMVAGKMCTEYVVKNTAENTQIIYWVASEKYDFFVTLVKLWNRKDKQSIYFNQIKDLPKGAMPMLSIETTLDGKTVLSKLEVIKLEKKGIDAATVAVPAEYKKFEQ
ncbi:MAG TPA: DUF4412 domain-containing protein [Bacteroidia bacterium]|jgi:hypothetical protein|nr:DUF4412 domain-containing protein [Bacteroidia bacterium]